MRINYGVNRKVKGGRYEHDNGTLDLPQVPADFFEPGGARYMDDTYHQEILGAIKERHPGWLVRGYAPADPHVEGRPYTARPTYASPTRALSPNLDDSGQNFAGVATIRAAIFDVLDHGDQDGERWIFYENPRKSFAFGTFAWTEDNANTERSNFVDAVIARIAELQNPPHEGVKLENLCPRHIKAALPKPTAMVCAPCKAEEKHGARA